MIVTILSRTAMIVAMVLIGLVVQSRTAVHGATNSSPVISYCGATIDSIRVEIAKECRNPLSPLKAIYHHAPDHGPSSVQLDCHCSTRTDACRAAVFDKNGKALTDPSGEWLLNGKEYRVGDNGSCPTTRGTVLLHQNGLDYVEKQRKLRRRSDFHAVVEESAFQVFLRKATRMLNKASDMFPRDDTANHEGGRRLLASAGFEGTQKTQLLRGTDHW